MSGYDPDANITMNTGAAEEEWYENALALQERLHDLKRSAILIPEALQHAVRLRRANEGASTIVSIIRGGSPRAQTQHH